MDHVCIRGRTRGWQGAWTWGGAEWRTLGTISMIPASRSVLPASLECLTKRDRMAQAVSMNFVGIWAHP